MHQRNSLTIFLKGTKMAQKNIASKETNLYRHISIPNLDSYMSFTNQKFRIAQLIQLYSSNPCISFIISTNGTRRET
jgi:hypothetical protein